MRTKLSRPSHWGSFCRLGLLGLLTITGLQAQPIPEINTAAPRAVTILPDPGPVVPPVPAADPPVPSTLSTGPAGTTFRLWIYDPRTRNSALGSPGIFLALPNTAFAFHPASSDGTLFLTLAPNTIIFDVVEPSSLSGSMVRKRYSATISATGTFTVEGVTVDARGFAAVTVTQPIPALVTYMTRAGRSALEFNPQSQCQLIDQIYTNRGVGSISAGFPRAYGRLPSYGRVKALVLPVDFPDVVGTTPPTTLFVPMLDTVRDFYTAQSFGRVAIDFSLPPKWLRMTFPSTRYGLGERSTSEDWGGYAKEVYRLTEGLIDLTQYDVIYVLPPETIPASSIFGAVAIGDVFPLRNGFVRNTAAGGSYLYGGGPDRFWRIFAHEIGHNFGLFDEHLNGLSQTLGGWGLMSHANSKTVIEINSWDRYLIGWLADTQVTCLPKYQLTTAGTNITINPLARQNTVNKVVLVPLSTTKVLVLESRKNEGLDVLAASLEGVVAYTVDMTLGQAGGGYRIQRRASSTDTVFFEDAALRTGDSVTVEGVTVTVLSLSANGDTVNVRAATAPSAPTLAVTRAGLGMGTVTSSPAGINCTPTCFANFASSSNVTLTAAPAAGSTFTGWSGDCSGTGTCTVSMNNIKNITASFYGSSVAGTYNGLWWIPTESGWGMNITQRAGINFMAWYTYDATGAPLWYVIPNCPVVGYGCTGEIYIVSGGSPLTVPWNSPTLAVSSVGTGTFLFSDADNGRFTFTINGVAGVKYIQRQLFGTGTTAPAVDYTALYWAAPANSESGWGVAITQQFNIIFVAIFTYDAARKPIWYVASNCTLVGSSCTGALYQVNGGRPPTATWGNPALNVEQVGSVTLNFSNASSGTMNFTINGVSVSKAMTKQIF